MQLKVLAYCMSLLAALPLNAELRGEITDRSGRGIAKATIITGSLFQATTDQAGKYSLRDWLQSSWKPKLIIVYAAGFRPVLKEVTSGAPTADAVLRPAGAAERNVRKCEPSQSTQIRFGRRMAFMIPSSADVRKYGDIDFTGDHVVLTVGGKPYALSTMVGPSCCGGIPVRSLGCTGHSHCCSVGRPHRLAM
jgi:hypothetical protein